MNHVGYTLAQPRTAGLLAAVIILASAAGAALAQSVVINGVPLVTSRSPVMARGSMLLPMRDVFEALNSEVKWFPAEQKVMATRGNTVIQLWLGRRTATINGTQVPLAAAPILIGGSTYVPLRFPAEAFGGNVTWDGRTSTAYIDIPPVGQGPEPPQPPQPPEPPQPPAEKSVEGTVTQVFLAANPSILVQTSGTGGMQIIQLGADTVITRNLYGDPPRTAVVGDLLPGDLVQASVRADGVASKLAASYGEKDAKVVARAGNTLLLDDGTALGISINVKVYDSAGKETELGALVEGMQIRLRYEPLSKMIWEIRLLAPIAPPPPTGTPEIFNVGLISPTSAVRQGDQIVLQLRGTAGGQATVTIAKVAKNLALQEVQLGTYQAPFDIPPGIEVGNATIVGNLTVGGKRAAQATSPTRLTIDSTPPVISGMKPQQGETLDNTSPTIAMSYGDPQGSGIDTSSVKLWVNRQEVTAEANVGPNAVSYNAQNLPAGQVRVDALVKDLAGNEASTHWTFTVASPRAAIITAAWHDAQKTLVAGEVLTVFMRVAQAGGTATFDVANLRQSIPMSRAQGQTLYQGTYTVQAGDRATDAVVTVHYRDQQGREASMAATTPVSINANLPNELRITQPQGNTAVGDRLVVRGAAPPDSSVRVTISYRAKFVISITGQIYRDVVQVDDQGVWQTPEIDPQVPLFGKANEYTVLAELLGQDGTVTAQQQIKLHK
jgi:hypothetical protein